MKWEALDEESIETVIQEDQLSRPLDNSSAPRAGVNHHFMLTDWHFLVVTHDGTYVTRAWALMWHGTLSTARSFN